ncbi:Krueppel homolog 1 isoform X2 [Toxorhynchites rutilus septentrionalis]|nr:Krueppel homolog 1 isoform X2 [Toxorhynchites rutilus septentrionalis]XP_055640906.1 Krueppel homolog 1 isoform X2 [Toxorhynchites rutilus septentrionalis]XP_055640907.1 Krueppel homolog 1 isoform X2 [Toxorhynchites rutilus septentrionalis]
MVYYTGVPLLMHQTDNSAASQLCYNTSTLNDRGGEQIQPQQQPQQQQQRIQYQQHVVNLSNGEQLLSDAGPSTQGNVRSNSPSAQSCFTSYQPGMVPSNQVPQQSSSVMAAKFRCEQCDINFGSKSAHTSHMKSHAKQQQQQQQQQSMVEGKPSNGKSVNALSATQSTPSDPYQCDVCKKTFAVPARLVRHYRTHTGERPFECEFCHKMFSVKENLQVHRRIHTKERPYKCDICGRAFEHSGKLHRHMRIHTGERPHKCNVCGKTFIQSGQLVIHMRTHTGEKPYKCPVEGCGKGFTCSKQLKVHSRTHTGEKPYHCDICFRDFGYNHVLKLHRVQHYGSKCYKCTICDETFKSKKEMEAHIKGHANEIPDEDETDSKAAVAADLSAGTGQSGLEYSSSSSNLAVSDNIAGDEPMDLEENLPTPRVDFREQSCTGNDDSDSSNNKNTKPNDSVHYYSQFEQSVFRSYGVQSGVNPALLAAASIAAVATASGLEQTEVRSNKASSPPPLSFPVPSSHQQKEFSAAGGRLSPQSLEPQPMVDMLVHQQQMQQTQHLLHPQSTVGSNAFKYEPLAIMKHHGYFAPASQVSEYRSSSDIVRQVEAAIAGTENLLTPPRSSPESPDRSSSPESDPVLMADRDNNTLPPRKRKLYFKDEPREHVHVQTPAEHPSVSVKMEPSGAAAAANPSAAVRMSSVIQYAKAS